MTGKGYEVDDNGDVVPTQTEAKYDFESDQKCPQCGKMLTPSQHGGLQCKNTSCTAAGVRVDYPKKQT